MKPTQTPASQPTGDLAAMARSFARALRAENKSPRTIETYLEATAQLAAYLEREKLPLDVAAVSRDAVRGFVGALVSVHKPATAANRYRALQQFFKFCVAESEIEVSPMSGMAPPVVPEEPVPVLDDDQIRALLANCAGPSFLDRRDAAIIRLFDDSGIRHSELLGLQIGDIDLDDQVAFVLGKGGRRRQCPFGAATAIALDRYVRLRARHHYAYRTELWLHCRGPLKKSGLATMLRRRGERAGVGQLHPHLFRHTFAHNWLEAGGNEGDLMKLMGWKSREMLDRYGASAAGKRARGAHRRLSLGDRL